ATNAQLREEAQKLQAERTQYKVQLDEESRKEVMDVESQLARTETDLARIRNARDELTAQLSIQKASGDKNVQALQATKEMVQALETRISQMETENERLRLQLGTTQVDKPEDLANLT